MSSFSVCVDAVLPLFLVMAVGFVARRAGAISPEDVPKVNKWAFKFFMPIMLFYNIYTSDLSVAAQPKIIIFAVVCVLVLYGLSFGFVMLAEKNDNMRGVMIQGIYRSNFVIMGIPLAAQLVEGADLGPVVILVAVVIPIFNILAVITLEIFNGTKPSVGKMLLDVLKNPLIIGIAAGIVVQLIGLELPEAVESAANMIGKAASPLMLFLLGAFFEFKGIGTYKKQLATVCIGRLIVVPAIFLTVSVLCGIRGVELAAMIAIFGSPTAISSFTMTQQMGGDSALAGDIVVFTSALSCVTMFAWALVLKSLGMF